MIDYHADDYGMSVRQARKILELCRSHDKNAPLTSVSIVINSPAFFDSAQLIKPLVMDGYINIVPHINLVEGKPCCEVQDIPLLVNNRGTFANDFVSLWRLSKGKLAEQFAKQVYAEINAQLIEFLKQFPEQRKELRLDSHQHTHCLPAVFKVLMNVAKNNKCIVRQVRVPVEPTTFNALVSSVTNPANISKNILLSHLSKQDVAYIPKGCKVNAFVGIYNSGQMHKTKLKQLEKLNAKYEALGQDLEVLFHPVRMRKKECLDSQNVPFVKTCCSESRSLEQRWLADLVN